MKFLVHFITICLVAVSATSLALPPPPAQAPAETAYLAELLPERGSATRFTHRGLGALPPGAAFQSIRRAMPWLPMAPERVARGESPLSPDAPESVLRRMVLLSFPANDNVEQRLHLLAASGQFARVWRLPREARPLRFAQANTEPLGSFNGDPHRWQWALEAINAPGGSGAWHRSSGRATVGSLDSGIHTGHPDVPTAGLSNFRLHASTRVRYLEDPPGLELRPQELAVADADGNFPHHGTHVNTIMAAPINGQGIAGVCPTCLLQTIRTEVFEELPLGTTLVGRFGATALNMSFAAEPEFSIPLINFRLALLILADRDIALVAAAGNGFLPMSGWPGNVVPHGLSQVMKIGATDSDNHLWEELRILGLPLARRHPVRTVGNLCTTPGNPACVPAVIQDRCGNPGNPLYLDQCGSNHGGTGFSQVIDLVAPGAQVIAGLVPGSPSTPGVYIPVAPAPLNLNANPPAQTGLGVQNDGVMFNNSDPGQHNHGPMTGTSMATPHVTATAGLMRSINPLLSAAETRLGLKLSANQTVPGWSAARMGAGLLDAGRAVEMAAGQVRGQWQYNRLTPMFSMYAAQSQIPEEASAEEEVIGAPVPIHAWLYTTSPQLASAAMKGDLYLSDDSAFSPTISAAYLHSHQLADPARRIGIPVPSAHYVLPPGAGKGSFRNPASSFHVFTTPHSPLPGFNLLPLYRLSTHHAASCAAQQRKHLYTTRTIEALGLIGGTAVCNAQPMSMRYRFESIKGYVFDRNGPRPPEALALFRGVNAALQVSALIVETEQITTAFSGYSVDTSTVVTNPDFLGWVYPSFVPTNTASPSTVAADKDNDGLIDGLELAFGLNEQSADGDCDGSGDALEYGFAMLPADPMSPTASCTDGRISAVYDAPMQTLTVSLRNPVGPVALPADTRVIIELTGPHNGPTGLKGNGQPQCVLLYTIGFSSGWECSLDVPLVPAPAAAQAWQWTQVGGPLFQPGQNFAEIQPMAGLTDPVPANNLATF